MKKLWGKLSIYEKISILESMPLVDKELRSYCHTIGLATTSKHLLQLRFWQARYVRFGVKGLNPLNMKNYPLEYKFSLLHYSEKKRVSLFDLSVECGIHPETLRGWFNEYKDHYKYKEYKLNNRVMNKINSFDSLKDELNSEPDVPLTKSEKEELKYLRAEVAYLKKLQALVQADLEKKRKRKQL